MSRLRSTEPVKVRIGDCLCPGAPHPDGDFAYLRPRLTAAGGLAATAVLNAARDARQAMTELGMVYLLDGLVRWDLLDDAGQPVPCNETVLRSGALDWDETLFPLAEKAAELYTDSVVRPFVTRRGSSSSPSGPTADSTSASQDS